MSVLCSFDSSREEFQPEPSIEDASLPAPSVSEGADGEVADEEAVSHSTVEMLLESGCDADEILYSIHSAFEQQLPVLQDYPFLTPQLLPADERLDYTRSLLLIGLNKDALDYEFKGVLYRALCSLTEDERATVGKQLFQRASEAAAPLAAGALLAQVLGSMQKISELHSFIKAVDRKELSKIDNDEIKEFCAYDACREIVQRCQLPEKISPNAWSRFLIKRKLKEVRSSLLSLKKELESNVELRRYRTTKEYYVLLSTAIKQVNDIIAGNRFRRDVFQRANAFLKKLPIELRYGICLDSDSPETAWTEKEIGTIGSLLKKLPPLGVVATPNLFLIKKVKDIDDGDTLGARYGNGPIEISMDAVNNGYVRSQYAGVDSLAIVLCHELGHAFKFGRWGDRFTVGSQEEIEGEAYSRYDFASYMALSGWEVFPRHRYQIVHSGFAVRLDETKELPLNFPVFHEEERKIFVYDEDSEMLYAYDADASFSLHSYGRSDPYEDWAEAFSEYVLAPRRLVMYAPEKFAFFESCFACHKHNQSMQQEWQRRLALDDDYDGIEYLPED